MNTPPMLGLSRELADQAGFLTVTPRLHSMSSRFLYHLFDEHAAHAGTKQGAGWLGGLLHRQPQDSQACQVDSLLPVDVFFALMNR